MAEHEEGAAPADFKKAQRQKSSLTDQAKIDRLPPHSIEAEQGVLACCLLDPNVNIPVCVEKLSGSEVFYDLRHRSIYETLVEMAESCLGIEIITLQQELRDKNQLEGVGGLAYLAALPDAVPSAVNLSYYLETIREKFALRKLIGTCVEAASRAYEHQGEVDELLDEVERDIHRIVDGAQPQTNLKTAKELVKSTIDRIEYLHSRQGQIDGLTTGFPDLDKMTGGLRGGQMIVIAARPSVGKSSIAMNIAEHVAVDLKLPVGVFSLEMTSEELMMRLVCSHARVNSNSVRDGFLAERDFPRLASAAGQLSKANLIIDDSSGLSILQLRAKARRLAQQFGIKFLVVDYLQLLHAPTKKSDNRQQEVSAISSGTKELAKELGIPVLILSQLNREMEKGGVRKPRLSDLRESGSIEQDADVVGLLYRPSPEEDRGYEPEAEPIDLILAKQRNGATGTIHLTFLKSLTRFESAAKVSADDVPDTHHHP